MVRDAKTLVSNGGASRAGEKRKNPRNRAGEKRKNSRDPKKRKLETEKRSLDLERSKTLNTRRMVFTSVRTVGKLSLSRSFRDTSRRLESLHGTKRVRNV